MCDEILQRELHTVRAENARLVEQAEEMRRLLADAREASARDLEAKRVSDEERYAADEEIARLRKFEPALKSLTVSDDGLQADAKYRCTGEFREQFAIALASILEGQDALNYVSMKVIHQDGREFEVCVRLVTGKTPAQACAEAKAERDAALAQIVALRPLLEWVVEPTSSAWHELRKEVRQVFTSAAQACLSSAASDELPAVKQGGAQ
jgi:hypothetical protein